MFVISACDEIYQLLLFYRYFARLGRGQISVYETPECNLLDKRSIKLENVQDFQWSPKSPVISAYQAEQSSGNLPARVVLLQIPEKIELRQKNLFSVSGEKLFFFLFLFLFFL